MGKRRRIIMTEEESETDEMLSLFSQIDQEEENQRPSIVPEDKDVQEQPATETAEESPDDLEGNILSTATVNDLPSEILLMILRKLKRTDIAACRFVNWRFRNVVNEHLIPCDKPNNCYFYKDGKALHIGELESNEEVLALMKKIDAKNNLESVTIDWTKLWGNSSFNDSFLYNTVEENVSNSFSRRTISQLLLRAKEVGGEEPTKLSENKTFAANKLTVDIKKGLTPANTESILKEFGYFSDEVHIPRGRAITPFTKALLNISDNHFFARKKGSSWKAMSPPSLGLVLEKSSHFRQIMIDKGDRHIKLCSLEVIVKDKAEAECLLKILEQHAKVLKYLNITMATTSKTNPKQKSIFWPEMSSLEKLEVSILGGGIDTNGKILPPLIKFRYDKKMDNRNCIVSTFPSLKTFSIRPPMAKDDKKWDAMCRAYYVNFLLVRRPNGDAPLAHFPRRFETVELVFPPKGESQHGDDKYQRFCLELTNCFKIEKAYDVIEKEFVPLRRFH